MLQLSGRQMVGLQSFLWLILLCLLNFDTLIMKRLWHLTLPLVLIDEWI